jgi:hypothetical protein
MFVLYHVLPCCAGSSAEQCSNGQQQYSLPRLFKEDQASGGGPLTGYLFSCTHQLVIRLTSSPLPLLS